MKTFYLHFNRNAVKRGDKKVWSIQTSKGCFHAEKVMVEVPLETVYRPQSKSNPRAFLKGRGNGYLCTLMDDRDVFLLTSNTLEER